MKLAAFLLATIIITNIGPSCITSSQEFSVEAVISNYSLQNLDSSWQRTEGGYAFTTISDSRLITLISETKNPQGLSVRIQIPTEITETNQPLLKLVSNSATGRIRPNVGSNVNGWNIDCKDQTCNIEKNDVSIQTQPTVTGLETSLEIKHSLSSCDNCRGLCITAAENPVCIDMETKQEIDTITKYLNISNNLNELLNSYRVTSEFLPVKDLSPTITDSLDWQQIMQKQLLDLRTKKIISITDNDIQQISSLAKKGQAGERYRIVSDSRGSWTYYYNTPGIKSQNDKECKAYQLKVENSPANTGKINPYYLIPIILVCVALFLLIILAIISKALRKKRKI